MRHRVSVTLRVASAVALGVALSSCAQATSSTSSGASYSALASAGAWVSTAAAKVLSVVESQTTSFALDRIDQRKLPLDNRYQRRGTGEGVVVYVFDGGVSATHPELAGRVRRGFSAFPADSSVCNPHGTAVAGAIGGATLGVAPGVEIVDVKMVECQRLRGTIRGIVDGAMWVLADMKKHPGRRAIANWSFIADTAAIIPALDSTVKLLVAAGIPVIVSAGNFEMNACRVSPANSPGTIVVGASSVYRDANGALRDRRAPNTAYGPCIDVYAPGDSVLLPSLGSRNEHTVQLWNGTSMATGYVTGAAALFLEANPRATVADVAKHIRRTATPQVVAGANSPFNFLLYVGAGEARGEAMRVTIR